jgi:hypothetical protein
MGKNAKEHKKRVAKRNARLAQQKSGMQKAFDMLVQQQLAKLKEDELKIETNGQEMNYDVVQDKIVDTAFSFIPNDEASSKINNEFGGNVAFKEENPEIISINQDLGLEK